MLTALLLRFIVAVHGTDDMLDIVDKSLAICKTSQKEGLSAVRALGFALFNPRA